MVDHKGVINYEILKQLDTITSDRYIQQIIVLAQALKGIRTKCAG